MPFKRHLPRFLLVVGFLSLSLIIIFQGPIKDFLGVNFDKAREYAGFIFYDLNFEYKRQKPITLLKKETELRLYIGEPFRSFNRSDWENFWNIIYGIFPKTDPNQPGLVAKRRQLTEDEIAAELKKMYPQPFIYFMQDHWNMFFEVIFKK